LHNGKILAAAHEERFSRKKHDPSFPSRAIEYVLHEAGATLDDLECIAFYDKPWLKFERLLETYHGFAPKGLKSFLSAMPVWIKEKLFMKKVIRDELTAIGEGNLKKIIFPEHHLSHAASAFYPSPYENAAILTIDGVGEWATTTIGHGIGNNITILRQLDFPHSIGLLYSAFTYYCGFKVNSGEYKLMGLAPYGNPDSAFFKKCKRAILDELVDIRHDGSLLLNMDCFNFATGLTMCRNEIWQSLFGMPKRESESDITQPYMDLALAIQQVTEEVVLRMADTAGNLTGCHNLVMAGGVALNCVANGKLLRKGKFKGIWIQPAAGDAGGALGAAYAAWHIWKGEDKRKRRSGDGDDMAGGYLGPGYESGEILRIARKFSAPFEEYSDFNRMCKKTVSLISQGYVVGWFQGRMEFGPRALGNRSILGDPRNKEMQKKLNLKIKYREGFRPFAPSVLEEDIDEYFDIDRPSPYMLMVAPVRKERRYSLPDDYETLEMYDRLYHARSDIPAVTHVDFSARIQSVSNTTNEKYWMLIHAFKEQTGCGLLVNTSFNVRGEPIVCTPEEAYACFMRTEMDFLVMESFLFKKSDQPEWGSDENWQDAYELD